MTLYFHKREKEVTYYISSEERFHIKIEEETDILKKISENIILEKITKLILYKHVECENDSLICVLNLRNLPNLKKINISRNIKFILDGMVGPVKIVIGYPCMDTEW